MTNELDLQEETRMWDTYNDLQDILARLENVTVFPSLVWLWSWDVVVDKVKNYGPDTDDEYVVKPGLELSDIFKMFWEDADKNGFTLEYGVEDLDEHVWDWMIDRDIVIPVEDLEEEEDEGE
jgi:hypothetical protein